MVEIEDVLKEKGALMFGDFTLTSGRKSGYYVNIKKAYTDPAVLGQIAHAMAEHVSGGMVAGVELGAIPLLVAVSLETGKRFAMIRKEGRQHGTSSRIEGEIGKGVTVDIIEDVTTTGGSVLSAITAVREAGGRVGRVIAVVDRGEGAGESLRSEGVELRAVVTADDLRRMLAERRSQING